MTRALHNAYVAQQSVFVKDRRKRHFPLHPFGSEHSWIPFVQVLNPLCHQDSEPSVIGSGQLELVCGWERGSRGG